MVWSNNLKKHHKRTKENSLNGFKNSSRIKIPHDEELDLMRLQMKMKEIYCSYEERTADIKMVDIASKVAIRGGISITTIAAIIAGSPVLALGGGVLSIGLSALLELSKSKMKLE